MRSRVPPDAFATYLAMGEKRSYAALATQLGVSKAAVASRAARENWAAKLVEAEKNSSQRSEVRAMETLEEMSARHIKIVRAIQARALEALKSMPISTASAAVRALVESVKLECLLRGQPSERTAVSIEETIRKEYEKWFSPPAATEGREVHDAKPGGSGGHRGADEQENVDDDTEA